MFDFSPLKKLLSDAGEQMRTRQVQLEKLKREREDIAAAPTSREDVIRALHDRIDKAADTHMDIFASAMRPLILKGDTARLDAPLPIVATAKSGSAPTPASIEAGLCLVMGDQMKAAATRIIEAMEWPSGALDDAVKQKKILELDSKISGMEAELTALVNSARAHGVSI